MLGFVLSRILKGFYVLLGVILVVFLLFHVLPGDPTSMMLGQRADVSSRKAIEEEYHLNKPLPTQLLYYLNDVSPISLANEVEVEEKYSVLIKLPIGSSRYVVIKAPYLRRSFQSNRRVTEIINEGLFNTFVLAILAMAFATVFGIFFGVIAALKQNTWIDHALISGTVLGISMPSFVAATLISYWLAFKWHDVTGLYLTGQLWNVDPFLGKTLELKNLILPVFTLGIRPLSVITQLTRGSMLDTLTRDYVRTARAKGLPEWKVVSKHALRNALNPVITAVSGWLASLMAGAFFIEYIFDWKGLGSTTINAVFSLDFPVVMGSVIYVGALFTIITILVDIVYAVLDPRVRLS